MKTAGIGALLLVMAAVAPVKAQRLGGVPDRSFNPADSGLWVPQLYYKHQQFYPGPQGSLLVNQVMRVYLSDDRKLRYMYYGEQYDHDLKPSYRPNTSGPNFASIRLMEARPGTYYGVGYLNGRGNYYYDDSLYIQKAGPKELNRPSHAFYFAEPMWGKANCGIAEVAAERNAFWITNSSLDTLMPHNQTTVILLDTAGRDLGQRTTLLNFVAQKSAQYQGNIYLLGRSVVSDSVLAETEIRMLNGATLNPVLGGSIGLGSLLVDEAQLFAIDNSGKMLIGGYLNRSVQTDQLIRLMPDGTADPSFLPTAVGGRPGVCWQMDEAGTVRAAWNNADSQGLNGTATLATVGTNGGMTQTTVPLDATWPQCRPLMFHPAQNAFLFETCDLTAVTQKVPGMMNFSPDSAYGIRYRFYVSYGQKVWSLVNHAGVGFLNEMSFYDSDPVRKKLLVSGRLTQVNGKLLPGLAVLNADGTPDPAFKGLLHLPPSLRDKLLLGTSYATFTRNGKILTRGGQLRDSLWRLMPDGMLDASFTPRPFRAYMNARILQPTRNGFVYPTANMVASPNQSGDMLLETHIVETDPEGNLMREYGSYTPTGYPDTLPATGTYVANRGLALLGVDNHQGVWTAHSWNVYNGPSNTYIYRQYMVRFDTTGRHRVLYSPEYQFGGALKLEMLAGKRTRVVGLIHLIDGTQQGSWANEIVMDSTGKLDPTVPPKTYLVPDVYGRRGAQYVRPMKLLPDGKILCTVGGGGVGGLLVRYYPDGRFDPTFMPIQAGYMSENGIHVMGDRLYLGGYNLNGEDPTTPDGMYYTYGRHPNNGLASFLLSSRPENTGYVMGHVERVTSPATGCAPAGVRRAAPSMFLKAMPAGRFAFTDTGGNYTMVLDTGNFSVSQVIQNNFLQRQVCPAANAPRTGRLEGSGNAIVDQNYINQTFDCPRLDLQVLTPRFRLCSRGTMRLLYKNDGVAAEPSARVRLHLPQEVRLLSANRPYQRDSDSTYVFDLGRLNPGQHGELVIVDSVACLAAPDSLARACFSARIEPLSLCSNIDPTTMSWDGAWLDAEARYIASQNAVRLVIRNRGSAMADSTPAQLTSNGYAFLRGKIKLRAGDSLVYTLPPAVRGTIQLMLKQTPNCPLGSNSTLGHSGRSSARTFLHFGPGLLETYTAQACPTFRYSLDPNEKLAEPAGAVEPGTEMHYTIHFENYGNDTAYAVSVEDSLPAGLDVNTLRLGASSHPCQVVVEGNETQPVLYFNFNPIKLTGKRQDSVLSKGQVEFSIRTKANVARGSVVMNRAHIYFDRNPAVTTDYAKTPIAQLAVTDVRQVQGKGTLSIYPNPASGLARVAVPTGMAAGTLRLLSPEGRQIQQQTISSGGAVLDLKGLTTGIYIVLVDGLPAERLVIIR